jgi:sarcosine oxidase subunit beta
MQRLTCDVAILGAGVNGMSIAYELGKRKKKVIVVDKVVMGAGASGSCDDMILLQSKKPGILLEMAFRSLELFEGLKDELPCDIEFESRGGTILIEDNDQLSAMESFVASQNRYGLEVEIIDAKKLKELQPLVSPHVIASTYSSRDSQVNPMALMRGFFFAAKSMGMEYLSRAKPKAIERMSDHWRIVLESGDLIDAGCIVNAAGAWANDVSSLIGFEVPIKPRKGQVLVTEAIPPIGTTNVWSAQYIVSKLKAVAPSKDVLRSQPMSESEKYGLGFAFTGTHNGNYLIGSTREDVGYDKTTNPEAIRLLSCQVEHFFPIMKKIHCIRTFAGLRPSTPDGMPCIGEVPGAENFFIAAGHEGDGIALSPITGVLLADMIEGKKTEFSLDAFRPDRFGAQAGGIGV